MSIMHCVHAWDNHSIDMKNDQQAVKDYKGGYQQALADVLRMIKEAQKMTSTHDCQEYEVPFRHIRTLVRARMNRSKTSK